MAYYLSMNGVNDKLVAPSLTFTEVIIDMSIDHKTSTAQVYVDARPGVSFASFSRNTSNVDVFGGGGFNSVWLDGVSKTDSTAFVPTNTRCTARIVKNTAGTAAITFFSHNSSSQYVKGFIYRIKIYNGTSTNESNLVAHYDMTLGNVQDQSGNGRHATLTGGTWVNDTTGTTQEGSASVTGVSTVTASATVIPAAITGSASLQGVAIVSATADVVNAPMLGSASLQGVGTATATASVIRSGSANITGVSTVTASAAGLAVIGSASLTGVGWVMASAEAGASHISKVHLYANQETSAHLRASQETTVYLYASMSNSVVLEGDL